MPPEVPDHPLAFIRSRVKEGRILWTYHVNMRMRHRHISRDAILAAADAFEIVEEYPDDKYLPSFLIRAEHAGTVFHVLFAVDVPNRQVRIVTAYPPDPAKWSPDARRRLS